MKSKEEIEKYGFVGFKTIAELSNDCTCIPKCEGVYLVLFPENLNVEFLTTGTGGFFKGKDPNVQASVLKENWVLKSNIVYIGKATSLKQRLKQYLQFGAGGAVGHYGGRYIWQLKNSQSLIICWKTLNGDDPREIESKLIKKFTDEFGKLPFANLCK